MARRNPSEGSSLTTARELRIYAAQVLELMLLGGGVDVSQTQEMLMAAVRLQTHGSPPGYEPSFIERQQKIIKELWHLGGTELDWKRAPIAAMIREFAELALISTARVR